MNVEMTASNPERQNSTPLLVSFGLTMTPDGIQAIVFNRTVLSL
jgi:hypothetical protein